MKKLRSISDADKLPSVLTVEEVSEYLVQLLEVIRSQNVDVAVGAEKIYDLICALGYSKDVIPKVTYGKIFDWIKESYEPDNEDYLYWAAALLISLQYIDIRPFIACRLNMEITVNERMELEFVLENMDKKNKI